MSGYLAETGEHLIAGSVYILMSRICNMKSLSFIALAIILSSCSSSSNLPFAAAAAEGPRKHLKSFSSEAELQAYFKRLEKKRKRLGGGGGGGIAGIANTVTVAASAAPREESITNVQHAGVDEGGIVKTYRNFLVVLRRGRLFTVDVADGRLAAVSYVDAIGPDLDPDDAWYDEMLISKNNIVVIGYSYEREGTEIGLFRISDDGTIRHRGTYHLRSNDYYSSRNYSSRLIGDRLIFYTPHELDMDDPQGSIPSLRKWRRGQRHLDGRRTH